MYLCVSEWAGVCVCMCVCTRVCARVCVHGCLSECVCIMGVGARVYGCACIGTFVVLFDYDAVCGGV